jgi:hypothetical protein
MLIVVVLPEPEGPTSAVKPAGKVWHNSSWNAPAR